LPLEAPPFDRITDADFEPALAAGMAGDLADARAISNDPAAPTFDNTIVALERSGRLLDAADRVFENLVASNANDTLNALHAKEAPLLQAHFDEVLLDPKLYSRVRAVFDARATLGLTSAQNFLVERWEAQFVRAGANLADADKTKLRAVDADIAAMQAHFDDALVKITNASAVVVSDRSELAGLGDDQIAAAASEAARRHLPGKYVLVLEHTTQQPIAASLKNRELRRRLLAASERRGDRTGPDDLRGLIATLAQKRAERARLLGYPTFAAYTTDDQMAKTPAAARKLLLDLVPLAVRKARSEANELQSLIDAQHGGFKLTAADWEFYAAQVRTQKYSVDPAEVRQYFQVDKVLNDGLFFAANKLYGLTFKPRPDLPVYQPDVKAYEVFDADGSPLALFYADYFARPNKQGGAWCNLFDTPSGLESRRPLVVNVANFTKPKAGEPALITFDEVTTMFHEFGHALHAMFSAQYYPSQDGFAWPTDAIEFPSQFNEHWALDPTVLANYAKNYKTGAPIPDALIAKLKAASTYGHGYDATETVAASLLDLDWHDLAADAPKQDPDAFEAASLKNNGIDVAEVPPRYRSTYFSHIWSGGYAANYYSYLWAAVLDDDAFDWFTQHGGLTLENGRRFRDMVLTPGYTADPMTLYRAFRGGDPSVEGYERDEGLE
jgi:peptidyl-dipeptidase Dcp